MRVKRVQGLGGLPRRHVEKSAPDSDGLEGAGFEARDDAEVVAAALEGAPEIWVLECGSRGDFTTGEHNFIADDVGAHQAVLGGEK